MYGARDFSPRALLEKAWIWSFVGAFAVWLAAIIHSGGQGAGDMLVAALSFSTFFVLVGIGQMFVITTGPGNVDLSIPANMALSGAVAMKVMGTDNSMIAVGMIAALLAGAGVGTFNYILIRVLRIPPIIATLSASFLVQSTAIAYGRGLRIKPPPIFADFTTSNFLGVPSLAICAVIFAILMGIVLNRTILGRSVIAIGQNIRAAWLAGVKVGWTRYMVYLMSGVFSGLAGALLSGFSGGASLNMGEEYLLNSIAVVVIGGTSVAGGKSNVPGIWGAAMFLFLLLTMLNTFGAGAGVRLVMTGLIIITVITVAGGDKALR